MSSNINKEYLRPFIQDNLLRILSFNEEIHEKLNYYPADINRSIFSLLQSQRAELKKIHEKLKEYDY